MISDCCDIAWSLYNRNQDEEVLLALGFIVAVSPVTIGYTVWRIILSNRASFRVRTVLSLDENSETCSDSGGRGISWTVVLYSLAAAVFIFEALPYIQSLIHD
jgi:hypothetical protein